MSQLRHDILGSGRRLMPAEALRVEVIADLICPFCFIGKRRMDRALDAVQGPYDVAWYPWQLNPDMPVEGLSLDEYLTRRFGSPADIAPALEEIAREGKDWGIDFRFDALSRVPNTLKAHQLMYLADREGLDQTALADELMAAFFESGADIGATDTLVELGGRHGLGDDKVVDAIGDETVKQSVLNREAQVRSSGIAGVPGFLLNRRLLIVGAQDTDVMINGFDRAMFGEGTDGLVSPALH